MLALTATQRKNSVDSRPKSVLNTDKRPPCPLCGSKLGKGEKLHSISYPADKEKIVHIHGCPYCDPAKHALPRRCPVCKTTLPHEGFAVGRMWEKKHRLHLHITGCTVCKPQYLVKAK